MKEEKEINQSITKFSFGINEIINQEIAKKEDEKNTEKIILKAAEEEFLTKGFAGAKTTEIAKRAGVTHAMLHYYFRTKDNLFEMVFSEKANLLANSFLMAFGEDLPFLEKLKKGIENHFDIIADNPKLPFFVFNEILINEGRKEIFLGALLPKVEIILANLKKSINEEVKRGIIRPIEPIDLILNIMSLNIFVFMAQPVINSVMNKNEKQYLAFLQQRKKNNVETILQQLRPENCCKTRE